MCYCSLRAVTSRGAYRIKLHQREVRFQKVNGTNKYMRLLSEHGISYTTGFRMDFMKRRHINCSSALLQVEQAMWKEGCHYHIHSAWLWFDAVTVHVAL